MGAGVGAILGWLGSIPCSIWGLRAALTKCYGNFTIQLIEKPIRSPIEVINKSPEDVRAGEIEDAVEVDKWNRQTFWPSGAIAIAALVLVVSALVYISGKGSVPVSTLSQPPVDMSAFGPAAGPASTPAAAAASATAPVVTAQEAQAIQLGMPLEQVQRIIGSKGVRTSSMRVGDRDLETYAWTNDDNGWQTNLTIEFENGLVQNITTPLGQLPKGAAVPSADPSDTP
ncbi:MAG TPA: hypothetical protein VMU59_01225 [Caulobacteraceae bacterium]|nr:hypothetical protein [Caulobacteraceae bacterium]